MVDRALKALERARSLLNDLPDNALKKKIKSELGASFNQINALHSSLQNQPIPENSSEQAIIIPSPQTPLPVPTYYVNTKEYVFGLIWFLVQNLYNSQPNHPMFGECEPGKIRAPFYLPGGMGVGTSWHKRVTYLAAKVEKNMGKKIPPWSCWLVQNDKTHIHSRLPGRKPIILCSYKIYRWLAFLQYPSEENWAIFTGTFIGPIQPFLHFCHNGSASRSGKHGGGCVNGIQHGRFGTSRENIAQKACRNLDRARCPGHGLHPSHCIYVHDNGYPKLCLNRAEGRPAHCPCTIPCF